jgi:hypothetical protein
MKRGIRNANVGVAVGLIALAIGAVFLHYSEVAMEFLTLGAFGITMGVMFLLDWLDDRTTGRKGSGRSS